MASKQHNDQGVLKKTKETNIPDATRKPEFSTTTPVMWKRTLTLWLFTAIKCPLMFFIRPMITQLDEASTHVKIKLKHRNLNPYGSMYFGALTTAAETVTGITVVHTSQTLNIPVSFMVKEFHGHYIRKADAHMMFISHDNLAIKQAIEDSACDGKARELSVSVTAFKETEQAIAAKFVMLISVKSKHKYK